MSLSQVMKNRESEIKVSNDAEKWELEHILANVLCVDLQQAYEFIRVMGSVAEKYRRYELLKEDEKIYLKEIVHQVLCRKSSHPPIFEPRPLGQTPRRLRNTAPLLNLIKDFHFHGYHSLTIPARTRRTRLLRASLLLGQG